MPCLVGCNDFESYDYFELLSVLIEEYRVSLAQAQAALVTCNNNSLAYQATWNGLTAELTGLESQLPGLYAAMPIISEANKIAEKA